MKELMKWTKYKKRGEQEKEGRREGRRENAERRQSVVSYQYANNANLRTHCVLNAQLRLRLRACDEITTLKYFIILLTHS
jgi:hypothetical protein